MTTLGVVSKWVGVPLALAVVGRFVIGPLLLPKMPASISKPVSEAVATLNQKVKNTFGGSSTPTTTDKPEVKPSKSTPAKTAPKEESTTSDNSSRTSEHSTIDTDQSGGPEVEVSVRSDRPVETHRARKPKHKA